MLKLPEAIFIMPALDKLPLTVVEPAPPVTVELFVQLVPTVVVVA